MPPISEPIIEEYNEDLENSFDFNEIDTSSHRKIQHNSYEFSNKQIIDLKIKILITTSI